MANQDNFFKGAFQLSRSIFESDLWLEKPAWWAKVWIYLIGRANHSDNGKFKRGDCFTTYNQIYVECGLSREGIKKKAIQGLIEHLKQGMQIRTHKRTRGFTITIINYDSYQTLNNYKRTQKMTPEGSFKGHTQDTKNKNEKNEKKNIYSIFDFWNSQNIVVHREIALYQTYITARLNNYSVEEIKEAISNYSAILKSDEHYFTHKWELDEFLSRKGGLDKFLTANKPFDNFRDRKTQEVGNVSPGMINKPKNYVAPEMSEKELEEGQEVLRRLREEGNMPFE